MGNQPNSLATPDRISPILSGYLTTRAANLRDDVETLLSTVARGERNEIESLLRECEETLGDLRFALERDRRQINPGHLAHERLYAWLRSLPYAVLEEWQARDRDQAELALTTALLAAPPAVRDAHDQIAANGSGPLNREWLRECARDLLTHAAARTTSEGSPQ